MSGPTFVNFEAVRAVILAARADGTLSSAEFRTVAEVAARIDPETGKARVSVRDLAKAVHTDPRTMRRRLTGLVERSWLERAGTGRPGYATEANTETYALGAAVPAPQTAQIGGGATPPHAAERGGA